MGTPSEDALAALGNKDDAPDSDIQAALSALKIPTAIFRRHIAKLRGAPQVVASTASAAGPAMQALSVLPQVPDDKSFIEMLKVGGELKIGVVEVLSAVKAGFARRTGLFELPEALLAKMEEFSENQSEPCGADFFRLQKLIATKSAGDVLTAIGIPGAYANQTRKRAFFAKLDAHLWKALRGFNNQLIAWQQSYMATLSNPALLVAAMSGAVGGAGMAAQGLMALPDTSALRAGAEAVIDEINKVFAGPGIPVARALAADADRILKILEDPALPVQLGAATKEQMIRDLHITVGADLVRAEQSITRFALATMSLKDVQADIELTYLGAMIQLGATIPWDKLETVPVSVPGRGRSTAGIGRTEEED
ncbi:MAG: hypothetical protein WCT25_00180 [Candidatus Paceibacterota bacterium]